MGRSCKATFKMANKKNLIIQNINKSISKSLIMSNKKNLLNKQIESMLTNILPDFGGGCSLFKAKLLAKLIIDNNLKSSIDIGVYRGRSLFPQSFAHKLTGGVVYGVDPYTNVSAIQVDREDIKEELLQFALTTDFEKIYEQVNAYKEIEKNDKLQERYGGMAYSLPILVRTAGLAQALSFVESKSKNDKSHPYTYLLNHLAEVVINNKGSEFAKQSRNANLQEYMYLTRRTMLALKWYKRFAETVLKVTSTTKGENGGEDESNSIPS